VSNQTDQSGNGLTVAQATGAKQPTYNTTSSNFGSKASMTFARASSQTLTNAAASPLITGTSATMCTAIKVASLASAVQVIFQYSGSSGVDFRVTSANNRELGVLGVADEPDSAATMASEIWCATLNTGPLQTFYVNGTATSISPNNSTPGAAGNGFSVGAGAGSANPAGVEMAEEVVVNRVLSLPEINSLVRYMGSRYAIAVAQ
jgi:hypothetical protein